MDKEPRKATDLLLDLESKIDTILLLIKNQDLNIKLISNKLNDIINNTNVNNNQDNKKIIVESIDSFNNIENNQKIITNSDFNIQVENNPVGFRRTSRPETFSGDDSYLNNNEVKFPLQIPNSEIVKDIVVSNAKKDDESFKDYESKNNSSHKENVISKENLSSVSVIQRVVDRNGKSVFLADVEILNTSNEVILKTRTNGTGKWMASLNPGSYKIQVRKRESLTKEKLEISQNVNIQTDPSSQELATVIIK